MKLTQGKAVAAVALLSVVACFFAVFLRLFSSEQLWGEMFAAVLGVIITAVITMVLLKGQSNDDVERERAAKIFEEKLRIYEEYLRTLCDVIKDRKLSDEEKILLEFQTSYVAMHCDPKYIATASEAVKKLIEHACPDEEKQDSKDGGGSGSPDKLLDCLFCIVEAFRKDLYGDAFEFDKNHKRDTLSNFSDAYRNAMSSDGDEAKKPKRIAVDLNVVSGSLVSAADVNLSEAKQEEAKEPQGEAVPIVEDTELWDAAVQQWKEEGWNVNSLYGEHFKLIYQDFGDIYVRVSFWQERFHIQTSYKGRNEFAQPIKWEKGGHRTGGTWWKDLDEPYAKLPQGKLADELKANRDFQQYIIGVVNELKGYLTLYHRCTIWKEAIGPRNKWNVFIWYWGTLACQLASEEEGTPYMDFLEDKESGGFRILLSNRKKNADLLNKTLKRAGLQDKKIENCSVDIEVVAADAVPERAKYWMQKIDGG